MKGKSGYKARLRGREAKFISLGGALIAPTNELDMEYISNFKNIILNLINMKRFSFVIVCGGGQIARSNQRARLALNPNITDEELDLGGIEATRSNAKRIAGIFGVKAYQRIIHNLNDIFVADKKVITTGGSGHGHSTDYVTAILAFKSGAKSMINLSNIDYVYEKDPKKNGKGGRGIKKMSWAQYMKMIPKSWKPGLSAPFDPIASKAACERNLEVVLLSGYNLKNLESYLNGESFVGTRIKNGLPLEYHPTTKKFQETRVFSSLSC